MTVWGNSQGEKDKDVAHPPSSFSNVHSPPRLKGPQFGLRHKSVLLGALFSAPGAEPCVLTLADEKNVEVYRVGLPKKLLLSWWTGAVSDTRYMCVRACKVTSVVSHCDPMNCCLPGSPVHGILQAMILEWVAMPSSRGIFWLQGSNLHLFCLLYWQAGGVFTTSTTYGPKMFVIRDLLKLPEVSWMC